MRFERRHQPLAPVERFRRHLVTFGGLAAGMLAVSLAIGTVGYHLAGGLPWLDSLLNASMILSGMGPVNELHTAGAKWFASGYAIFSGVAFLTSVGVFLAPIVHRLLHRFHLEMDEETPKRRS
jgi:hypothetical protein